MSSSILSQDIHREYNRLVKSITDIPLSVRTLKIIDGTGGKVSPADLIAYQIGWGHCLIRWYEAGINGKIPEMPGEGFSTWNYVGIARHFYQKYQYDSAETQMTIFHRVVLRILEIVDVENQKGNLDALGIWPWCTLPSGKQWPFSKWVKINTSSPYKRASSLIKKIL